MARCQRSKLLSPRQEEWIGCYDKHIGVLVRDSCERLINFGHCACIYGPQLSSVCNCRRLYVSNLDFCIWKCRIHKHIDRACVGHQFEDKFQPLLPERRRDQMHTGYIAAWPVVTLDELGFDWIEADYEDNRNDRGGGLCGKCRWRRMPNRKYPLSAF